MHSDKWYKKRTIKEGGERYFFLVRVFLGVQEAKRGGAERIFLLSVQDGASLWAYRCQKMEHDTELAKVRKNASRKGAGGSLIGTRSRI